jgi:radical SAM superfamily enzyme YgiQ (UPF0313 family)
MFGVSALTGNSIHSVLDAIELVRRRAPDLPIVWGGYHASQAFQGILAEGLADYVVRGPGEAAAVGLAAALSNPDAATRRQLLAEVPNLVYRDGPRIVTTSYERQGDMNDLPSMDYSLIDVPRYFVDGERFIDYVSSYGCPYACTFCAEPSHSLRRWRGLSPERVVDELVALHERYRPDRVNIQDPNFSSNPARVAAIAREMHHRGLEFNLLCDMRTRDVVRVAEKIDLVELREIGFKRIFIGVESGSDRMLKLIRKGSTTADAITACRLLDAAGIQSMTSFIHDFPQETVEDSEQTLDLATQLCQLKLNRQSHHFYTPYPMTELYGQLERQSEITEMVKTQREWANTSTFWGSKMWPGRPEFRRRVLRRLFALHREYPHAIDRSVLPVLRLVRFDDSSRGAPIAAATGAASPKEGQQ